MLDDWIPHLIDESNRCVKEDVVGIVQSFAVFIMMQAYEHIACIPKEQRSGVLYYSVRSDSNVDGKRLSIVPSA